MSDTTIDFVADTLQYNTVGWEAPDRLWRVQTRLASNPNSDKEIDIDDREARLLVSIELSSEANWDWKATKFKAVLHVSDGLPVTDAPNENILIETTDPATGVTAPADSTIRPYEITLFDHAAGGPAEVFPGVAIQKVLTVRTGLFSDSTLRNSSATPGTKNFRISLSYDLEPIVGDAKHKIDTRMVYFIATD